MTLTRPRVIAVGIAIVVLALGVVGAAMYAGRDEHAAPAPAARPELTAAQRGAARETERYLALTGLSRSALIVQLESEGYSAADAAAGIDSLQVNWDGQAARQAADYMQTTPMSRADLIKQLEFAGFTPAQATFGADSVGA